MTSDNGRNAAVLQPSSTLIGCKSCYGSGCWQNVVILCQLCSDSQADRAASSNSQASGLVEP